MMKENIVAQLHNNRRWITTFVVFMIGFIVLAYGLFEQQPVFAVSGFIFGLSIPFLILYKYPMTYEDKMKEFM